MGRTDFSKEFRVKIMGAAEEFNFNNKDFEQAVVYNPNAPDVYLRDDDGNDFPLAQGVSFDLSTLPSKSMSGLTVVTQASGAANIAYVQ